MEEEDSDEEEDYIYEDLYEDVEFSFWYLCLGPFVNGSAVSAFAHFGDTFRVQATLL